MQNLEKLLGLFDPLSSAGYEACLKTPLPNDISLKSQEVGGLSFCVVKVSCESVGNLEKNLGPLHIGNLS